MSQTFPGPQSHGQHGSESFGNGSLGSHPSLWTYETKLNRPLTPMIEPGSSRIPRWKRGLDLALVFLTFPLWLSLMVLVMILIKAASRGPVFYRQQRIGYRRKRFMIFKFRSMKVSAETGSHERHLDHLMQSDGPMTKLDAAGDPRLIPWGRILRASGLDELPQIFNVLRGEMSLVGPRPCTLHEFGRYQTWQQARLDAPPGLTGYWQVNGKNKTTFCEMIAMDIFYAKNMCLRLDLVIMAKTLPALMRQVLETWRSPHPTRREDALGRADSIAERG